MAVLALVGIAVGIYLAASGGSSPSTRLVAAPTLAVTTASAATTAAAPAPAPAHQQPTSGHPQSSAALPPSLVVAPRAAASQVSEKRAVAGTIQRHFSFISHHAFAAAYALLAPRLQTGESSWISAHEADGIYSVSVAVDASIDSSEAATATVIKMTTLDGHGCKNWSGSWNLLKISGEWRINESNLSPTPC